MLGFDLKQDAVSVSKLKKIKEKKCMSHILGLSLHISDHFSCKLSVYVFVFILLSILPLYMYVLTVCYVFFYAFVCSPSKKRIQTARNWNDDIAS